MRRLRLSAVVVCLLPLYSQTPVAAIKSRFVELSAAVRDHKGQNISDLKKTDFTVFDRGKPQTISVFRSETTARQFAKLALASNVYANRLTKRGEVPTAATFIVFDGLNTRFRNKTEAAQQLLAFLREIDFDDRLGIGVLGRKIALLHDFTDDPEHLLKLLSNARADHPDMSMFTDAMEAVTDPEKVDPVNRTLAALETIANHLAGVPGRKNLVWLSDRFPSDLGLSLGAPAAANPAAARALRAIDASSMAIYAVVKNPGAIIGLAESSGGHVFPSLRSAVRASIEDGNSAYTLGFFPSSGDLDGSYHPITLKVEESGVEVRARKGFIAFKDAPPEGQIEAATLETVASTLDSTAIPLFLRVDDSDKPERGSLKLTIQVDPTSITLHPDSRGYTGALEVDIAQRSANDNSYTSTSETFNLVIPAATLPKVIQDSLLLTVYAAPQKGSTELRLVVLDKPSGTMGSIHLPLVMRK